MAMTSRGHGGGGEDEVKRLAAELSKTLKEGERLLAPTRRPDGSLRKPIRIRAGFTPQDEVPKYQSKGALWKKEMQSMQEVPPGYEPVAEAKPKTKAAKRNDRKKKREKEKKEQAALDQDNNSEKNDDVEDVSQGSDFVESVVPQMNGLTISGNSAAPTSASNLTESANNSSDPAPDIDKKIRALKKKIRLAEAQQQKTGQQSEKEAKVEGWRMELKNLEDRKAELANL